MDCGYERVVRIVGMKTFRRIGIRHRENILATVRDLHFACGGKVYWDEVLLWENYVSVGKGAALHVTLLDEFFVGPGA